MDIQHELVEVHPVFPFHGACVEEQIHEHRLPRSDVSVQVQTLRGCELRLHLVTRCRSRSTEKLQLNWNAFMKRRREAQNISNEEVFSHLFSCSAQLHLHLHCTPAMSSNSPPLTMFFSERSPDSTFIMKPGSFTG